MAEDTAYRVTIDMEGMTPPQAAFAERVRREAQVLADAAVRAVLGR